MAEIPKTNTQRIMKVIIRSNRYPQYPRWEEREMSQKEILHLRMEIRTDILSWFKWEDYQKQYRHLVIFAELPETGEGYIYREGLITTEEEFDRLVAKRVSFADCIHKKDLPPEFIQ